jgi:hypothetical protein
MTVPEERSLDTFALCRHHTREMLAQCAADQDRVMVAIRNNRECFCHGLLSDSIPPSSRVSGAWNLRSGAHLADVTCGLFESSRYTMLIPCSRTKFKLCKESFCSLVIAPRALTIADPFRPQETGSVWYGAEVCA